MAQAAARSESFGGMESFAALLEETLGTSDSLEGTVVKGRVISIENDTVLIDVGLKSEGRVALKEFGGPGGNVELKAGDTVEVYLERMEDKNGEAVLSREKARREEAWTLLEKTFNDQSRVTGMIFGRVKGGFTVDLNGAVAFLPGSQVDIRPVRDISPLLGTPQPFQILKMDRSRGNIVVSRRAVLEESRAEARSELVANLKEGQVLKGVVKNITDYGAFVDLGGVDGLLHVTDIAWRRINHPSEALKIGQTVKVQVIRFNPETQRISLGMKQLEADPWEGVEAKYPVGAKFKGRVTNITDYGAFVELEPGVEGLVHVSEMSWTKKNVHPGKIVSTSQEVEVMVLDVDPAEAPHQPRPQAVPGQPVGGLRREVSRRAPSSKARSGTSPSSACSSACPAISTAWSTCPISTGTSRARKPSPTSRRAIRSRSRCSTSMSRRSASASASSSSPPIRSRVPAAGMKKGDVVTATVTAHHRWRYRGRGRRRFLRLHPQVRSVARPLRAAPGPLRGRRKGRRQGHPGRSRRPPHHPVDQGAARSKRRSRRWQEFGSSDSGASLGDILGAALRRAQSKEQSED